MMKATESISPLHEKRSYNLLRLIFISGLIIIFSYSMGLIVGGVDCLEEGIYKNGSVILKIVIGTLGLCGSGYGIWKLMPRLFPNEPTSIKVRRARWALILRA